MRLVDADALIEAYDRAHEGEPGKARQLILDAPTIKERKTGRWIYGEKDGQDGWYCSECKGFIPWDYDFYGLNNIDFIKDFKTCPFCDSRLEL